MFLDFVKSVSLLAHVVALVARINDLQNVSSIRIQLPYSVLRFGKLVLVINHAVLGLKAFTVHKEEEQERSAEVELKVLIGRSLEVGFKSLHVFNQRKNHQNQAVRAHCAHERVVQVLQRQVLLENKD